MISIVVSLLVLKPAVIVHMIPIAIIRHDFLFQTRVEGEGRPGEKSN